MVEHKCPKCHKLFSSAHRLQSHLNRITPCQSVNMIKFNPISQMNNNFICEFCGKKFARRDNVLAHIKKNRCTVTLKYSH